MYNQINLNACMKYSTLRSRTQEDNELLAKHGSALAVFDTKAKTIIIISRPRPKYSGMYMKIIV